jgi:hypothetical protein
MYYIILHKIFLLFRLRWELPKNHTKYYHVIFNGKAAYGMLLSRLLPLLGAFFPASRKKPGFEGVPPLRGRQTLRVCRPSNPIALACRTPLARAVLQRGRPLSPGTFSTYRSAFVRHIPCPPLCLSACSPISPGNNPAAPRTSSRNCLTAPQTPT